MICKGAQQDKELWERCRRGDEEAFSVLFERYYRTTLRAVSHRVKDTMAAEELVMDTFFNLWTKRNRIAIEGEFPNYLFKCVFNSTLKYLRKEIRTAVAIDEVENRLQADMQSDHILLNDDMRQTYDAAVHRLAPRCRQAFLLSREENLSHAEISRVMSVSAGVVDNYITAALDGMRTGIKGCLSALAILLSIF